MYLAHAEACRRKAERAFGPIDRAAWLELAESWLRLLGAGYGEDKLVPNWIGLPISRLKAPVRG
jgi:hypothetical protein